MRIPISWLKEYVDIKISVKELSDKLNMSGTENEILSNISVDPGVVVGEILEVSSHPNADRLQVTKVNIGTKTITVVVGCPHNLGVGMKVPVVLAGTELPDGTKAEKVDLRGVTSEGMFRSEMELGVSEHNSGIMILEADAPAGASLDSVLKKDKDILEAELTPNRGDCLSMLGIAGEVSVITGQKMEMPVVKIKEGKEKASDLVSVEIKDKDLCRRYVARVIKNVKIGPSPKWMQDKLAASGVRPINNVVDVTNYVMLEMGQPLHAFDAQKVAGGKIIIRRAVKGEKIETLDGTVRELDSNDLVISDKEKAIAVAGVMGGKNSEVTDKTKTIVLESANFSPISVRKTALKLALRSESSTRFEKGLPLTVTEQAADRAAQLLTEIAGGEVLAGTVDEGEKKDKDIKIPLDFKRIKSFLGEDIDASKAVSILESLGFQTISKNKEKAEFLIPHWRLDVSVEADLLEEVARIYGYENIPSTLPKGALPEYEKNETIEISKKIREVMTALGFFEVYSYSFTSKEKASLYRKDTNPIAIANPLNQEQEYMRTDLLSSMLEIISKNKDYKSGKTQGLYEIANVYSKKNETPKLSGLIYGGEKETSLKYVKGTIDVLFEKLGINSSAYKKDKEDSARIFVSQKEIGGLVILNDEELKRFKIKSKGVCFFELDLSTLSGLDTDSVFHSIPKFPGSERDLTFVVEEKVTVAGIYEIISRVKSGIRIKAEVIEIYRGKGLPENKKSVSVRFIYQAKDRTLIDKEVDDDQFEIIKKTKDVLGGILRGEGS